MTTMASAWGVFEVDLLFPRNDTYAPTDNFPVVFGFQNPERAKYLNIAISTFHDVPETSLARRIYPDLRWRNWTDPESWLQYDYYSFTNEGHYKIRWIVWWNSCNKDAFEDSVGNPDMNWHRATWDTWFTISKVAPEVDLIAATAKETCRGEFGVAINVTDETMRVPSGVKWPTNQHNRTCSVVVESPMPLPDPCRIHLNTTVVESMEASLHPELCSSSRPSSDCPEQEKSAAGQLVVVGISGLLATLGAVGFFLV